LTWLVAAAGAASFAFGCASHRSCCCGAGTRAGTASCAPTAQTEANAPLYTLANPMQGTDSQRSFSHGNEYPAIALPFPMNIWAPYTQPQNDPFYYAYRQNQIRGIRQTHEPSPWIGDYANFSLMPVSGKLVVSENDRASTFRHQDEVAQPSYYKVHLDTWKATAEVTPTERAARFRFTFEEPTEAYVVLDYTNLYDAKTGFMRGRRAGGDWNEPFYPDEWGGPFTEGDSWQWSFSAMQDEPGLVKLMGGEQAFADKLDAVFAAAPTLRAGTYGKPIHEMTEMAAIGMGQYAHGNEPVHHLLYLYDYAGQPWKAQVRLRQAMTWLYQATPDGLCGDEDTGQMSAWYVLSALGFYPVCPGDPNYLIGSPLFDKATLALAGGKTFTVTARHNGPQEFYIQSARLNGAPFDQTFLGHDQITGGGGLEFEMGSAPNEDWGVANRPASPLGSAGKA
jgi:putative alpha-1,2-mannosidase